MNKIDINSYKINDKDTGSPQYQVALITQRILEISEHLKIHKKDHSTRRGLLKLVGKRKKLLSYLKRKSEADYKTLIEGLGLRK